jgi:hypothetical protein
LPESAYYLGTALLLDAQDSLELGAQFIFLWLMIHLHNNPDGNGLCFVHIFPGHLEAVDSGADVALGFDPVYRGVLVAGKLDLDSLEEGHEAEVVGFVI